MRHASGSLRPAASRSFFVLALPLLALGGILPADRLRPMRAVNTPPRVTSDFPHEIIEDTLRTGSTTSVYGNVLEFRVTVSDVDGHAVSLVLLNPPPGLAFRPVLDEAPPVTRTLRWDLHDTDYPGELVFEARDSGSPSATSRFVLSPRIEGFRRRGILIEDLDGDGRMDVLAHGTQGGTGVFQLWSDATAPGGLPTAKLAPTSNSIQFGLTSTASQGTYDLRLVDLTGDGRRDIVIGARNLGKLFVYEGGAGLVGNVAPRAILVAGSAAGTGPQAEMGLESFEDMDGDGVRDALIRIAGATRFWRGGATLSGTLSPQATLLGQVRAIGDVTGDGVLDAVGSGAEIWAGPATWSGEVAPTLDLEGGGGWAVGLRDCDGDGFLDILIEPDRIESALFWKGGPGVADAPLTPDATFVTGTHPWTDGYTFADVTGDGARDLVAWAGCSDLAGASCAGALFVWELGQPLSGTVLPTARLFDPASTGNEQAGQLVRIGDVSGDGVLDLVASAPYADVSGAFDAGVVHVWRGGPALLGDLAPTATLRSVAPATLDELTRITGEGGLQLADVTGDGVLDVLAAAQQKDVGGNANVGAVQVWAGGPGLIGALSASASLQVTGAAPGDLLGNIGSPDSPIVGPLAALGVRVAEVTGDAILDVIAITHVADGPGAVDAGAAYVWAGGPGVAGSTSQTATLRVAGASAGDKLGLVSGHGLQIADVSGDGVCDVIVGASLADALPLADTGAVYVWLGGALLSGTPAPRALTASDRRANDQLGLILERRYGQGILAGDVTGDGVLDLVVGCSEADVSGVSASGALYVWRGPIAASASETVQLRATTLTTNGRLGF